MCEATIFFHISYPIWSICNSLPWWKCHFLISFSSLILLSPYHLSGGGGGKTIYCISILWNFIEIKCKSTWNLISIQQISVLRPFHYLPYRCRFFARYRFYPRSTPFTPVLGVIYCHGFHGLLYARIVFPVSPLLLMFRTSL